MFCPQNKPSIPLPSDTAALPLERCLAKTWTNQHGVCLAGRSVEEHCRIVGAVARCLLSRMPELQRRLFPVGADSLPLVHDIGKACPTFQEKIYRAAGHPPNSLPDLKGVDPSLEKLWGGHSAVSLAALKGCGVPPYIAEIAGQHHGFLPTEKPASSCSFGGDAWQARRQELLSRLLEGEGFTERWPHVETPEAARLLAGLTIVADWIGSGARFDNPEQPWGPLVEGAVDAAGFLPWRVRDDLTFKEIFSFAPLKAQQVFYEQVKQPGVYILEAPMGMGKTEAALYAAYGMLQKGCSSGIYFALPTQLTSNRIHIRLNAFLDKILEGSHRPHAHLLHGKAWLAHFQQQEMGEDGAPAGAWFCQGRRGILAPFAAGTVDQALMAAMRVRHGAVRAYGLAGKTVILDEVHSYDAYTGVVLDALVALLRHYGCTVIILSATLTAKRRAYFTGRDTTHGAYPLISVSRATGLCEELPCPAPAAKRVELAHPAEDALAVEEALLRAEEGQQVLWIENTVAEAQKCYQLLAARAAELVLDVGLLHSRFTPSDRSVHEDNWTALFGKESARRVEKGRILIGTQVLEQSLDIDADFLVTRFCPTDMLLQRLGRLWRHENAVRPISARREAWLLHPPLDQVRACPQEAWGVTGYVYTPYVLFRSLELWDALQAVSLPSDIRGLLEDTYAERLESEDKIIATVRRMETVKAGLQSQALRGISGDSATLPEENVSTRAEQRPEAEVLLLRRFEPETGDLVTADGASLCLTAASGVSWTQKQEIAARLSMNIVRVPEKLAPSPLPLKSLHWLRPWLHCGHRAPDGMAALRVAIVRADGSLRELNGKTVEGVRYRDAIGYMTQ